MFSETQIQLNQTRFRDAFSNADYLFRLAAEDFIEFLPTIKSPPKRVLILGEFPLFSELTAKYPEILIDINCVFAHTPNIPSKHRYDIIVSMGQLHWIKDPVTYLQVLKDHLSPQGTLWVTFVGENSLSTLRRAFIQSDIAIYNGAYSRVIPTISASDGLQLMSHAGIPSPVVNRNSLELKHTSLVDLMIDLRHMFGGNALETRPKHVTSPNFFKKAEAALKGKRDYILTPIDLITLSTY